MDLPLTPAQLGVAGALLGIVVWVIYALLKGKIVPRSVVEDIRKDRNERLNEALHIIKIQQDAAEKRDKALSEIGPMLRELADNGQTVVALVEALKKAVMSNQVVGGP